MNFLLQIVEFNECYEKTLIESNVIQYWPRNHIRSDSVPVGIINLSFAGQKKNNDWR